MAAYTNQATLVYNNNRRLSNVAQGEVLEALAMTKTAVVNSYSANDAVTYVITLVNSSDSPCTNVTVTDDLGAYPFGVGSVTPLSYTENSAKYYVNGVLQPTVPVQAGPPLVFSGVSVPAGGNAMLLYEATANEFAPPGADGTITNTASAAGCGTASAQTTVTAQTAADLTISKSISPVPVMENGTVTYTFTILNYGNAAAAAADNVQVEDTFNPVLSSLQVALNGTAWVPTQYTYNESTGAFATVPGQITVPAAAFTQDPLTGSWSVSPGIATLTVSGTV